MVQWVESKFRCGELDSIIWVDSLPVSFTIKCRLSPTVHQSRREEARPVLTSSVLTPAFPSPDGVLRPEGRGMLGLVTVQLRDCQGNESQSRPPPESVPRLRKKLSPWGPTVLGPHGTYDLGTRDRHRLSQSTGPLYTPSCRPEKGVGPE